MEASNKKCPVIPKKLDIICQRFPYPARRGDQLAVSKLIMVAQNEGFQVRCFYVSGRESHCLGKTSFIKMRFSIFRFISQSSKFFNDPIQVSMFSGYEPPRIEQFGQIYVHTIRMVRTLPEEIWGDVNLAPQIDFSMEFSERAAAAKNPILRWILTRESELIYRWQHKHFPFFRKLFRVVDTEFNEYQNSTFVTSPHGFPRSRVSKKIKTSNLDKSTFKIGFWGNMKFKPNKEALEALLKGLGGDDRFELLIFGHASDECSSKYHNVTFLGSVDNIDESIGICDALVNLIATGGGFQNKTIEAWAQGCPVFGTPAAFRGLPSTQDLPKSFENADKLYNDLKNLDRISFADKSSSWVLTHWDQEKHSRAKLKELE